MTYVDQMLLNAKRVETTRSALSAGANVNARDKFGKTALMCAHTAEQTKLLIAAGADVNAKTSDGGTALMYANTAEQTKLLIAAGADVNARAEDGNTALMNAETAEQAKLLIEAGADANAKDEDGNTALYYAETKEQEKLIIKAMYLQYEKIEETKKRIKSTTRSLKGGKSGVVFVDTLADMKRSGKIKSDVTPKMAKKLRTQWMKGMKSNGGR